VSVPAVTTSAPPALPKPTAGTGTSISTPLPLPSSLTTVVGGGLGQL
jgi:hypothetical protein